MARLYRVADDGEIARRRKRASSGRLVEAWPDLHEPGAFWLGDECKAVLDGLGPSLPATLSLEAARVAIYYGPRLCDQASLPTEESLRARVISAHGMAVAWITLDERGERAGYEPQSPTDPVFYLRRPRAPAAHLWRLFRTRAEAAVYMGEYYGRDPDARAWAQTLPARDFEELVDVFGEPA